MRNFMFKFCSLYAIICVRYKHKTTDYQRGQSMTDQTWIYDTDADNLCRFSLGHCARSPLLCIGVNPSTASPEKLDPTLQSVARIAQNNNYDGWIMINLYPQRSTDPNGMHQQLNSDLDKQNRRIISSLLSRYDIPEIWAAWGTLITKRRYLLDCLSNIHAVTSGYNWITFGRLSKAGHPHHPLYLNAHAPKSSFPVADYIETMKKNR